ncbi:hypothetical protein CYMTET_44914 [Cymbomonas tetramitiformis]|uniref:Response regulatory domain-containing protein n=1 Tax=Cymbomonas tetramitiformis TaxID=36881 RepID=A0AAE0BZ92_9CHLO|nr:hypothetical protein CYMTET_44914 [Cymbomonas tetramitiformis]
MERPHLFTLYESLDVADKEAILHDGQNLKVLEELHHHIPGVVLHVGLRVDSLKLQTIYCSAQALEVLGVPCTDITVDFWALRSSFAREYHQSFDDQFGTFLQGESLLEWKGRLKSSSLQSKPWVFIIFKRVECKFNSFPSSLREGDFTEQFVGYACNCSEEHEAHQLSVEKEMRLSDMGFFHMARSSLDEILDHNSQLQEKLSSQELSSHSDDLKQLFDDLSRACQNGERSCHMRPMLNSVFDGTYVPRLVDMSCEQILRLFAEENGILAVVEATADPALAEMPVWLDLHVMRMVLNNLVSNALKYGSTSVAPHIYMAMPEQHAVELCLWNAPGPNHAEFLANSSEILRTKRATCQEWMSDGIGMETIKLCLTCAGWSLRHHVNSEGTTFQVHMPLKYQAPSGKFTPQKSLRNLSGGSVEATFPDTVVAFSPLKAALFEQAEPPLGSAQTQFPWETVQVAVLDDAALMRHAYTQQLTSLGIKSFWVMGATRAEIDGFASLVLEHDVDLVIIDHNLNEVLSEEERNSLTGSTVRRDLKAAGFKGIILTRTENSDSRKLLDEGFDDVLPKTTSLAQQIVQAWPVYHRVLQARRAPSTPVTFWEDCILSSYHIVKRNTALIAAAWLYFLSVGSIPAQQMALHLLLAALLAVTRFLKAPSTYFSSWEIVVITSILAFLGAADSGRQAEKRRRENFILYNRMAAGSSQEVEDASALDWSLNGWELFFAKSQLEHSFWEYSAKQTHAMAIKNWTAVMLVNVLLISLTVVLCSTLGLLVVCDTLESVWTPLMIVALSSAVQATCSQWQPWYHRHVCASAALTVHMWRKVMMYSSELDTMDSKTLALNLWTGNFLLSLLVQFIGAASHRSEEQDARMEFCCSTPASRERFLSPASGEMFLTQIAALGAMPKLSEMDCSLNGWELRFSKSLWENNFWEDGARETLAATLKNRTPVLCLFGLLISLSGPSGAALSWLCKAGLNLLGWGVLCMAHLCYYDSEGVVVSTVGMPSYLSMVLAVCGGLTVLAYNTEHSRRMAFMEKQRELGRKNMIFIAYLGFLHHAIPGSLVCFEVHDLDGELMPRITYASNHEFAKVFSVCPDNTVESVDQLDFTSQLDEPSCADFYESLTNAATQKGPMRWTGQTRSEHQNRWINLTAICMSEESISDGRTIKLYSGIVTDYTKRKEVEQLHRQRTLRLSDNHLFHAVKNNFAAAEFIGGRIEKACAAASLDPSMAWHAEGMCSAARAGQANCHSRMTLNYILEGSYRGSVSVVEMQTFVKDVATRFGFDEHHIIAHESASRVHALIDQRLCNAMLGSLFTETINQFSQQGESAFLQISVASETDVVLVIHPAPAGIRLPDGCTPSYLPSDASTPGQPSSGLSHKSFDSILDVCHRILEHMNFKLECTSNNGHPCYSVTMPSVVCPAPKRSISSACQSNRGVNAPSQQQPVQSMSWVRVAVLDDCALARRMLQVTLRSLRVQSILVLGATREEIHAFSKMAVEQNIHLVILDQHLDQVLGKKESQTVRGTYIVEQLRQLGYTGMAMLRTADDHDEIAVRGFLELGFDAVIGKTASKTVIEREWHNWYPLHGAKY